MKKNSLEKLSKAKLVNSLSKAFNVKYIVTDVVSIIHGFLLNFFHKDLKNPNILFCFLFIKELLSTNSEKNFEKFFDFPNSLKKIKRKNTCISPKPITNKKSIPATQIFFWK